MATGQVIVPWVKGYDLGVGADLATGSPMNKAVDAPATPVDRASGATVGFRVHRIQSTEELESALGISAEASYGCGAFGAGISARFDFAKKSKIQSNSLFMLVTASVELPFLSIDEPNLSQNAQSVIDRPDVFKERFGNMFVRGMGRGGLFVGTLRIETSSSEESMTIGAELEGSYGLFSAEAKTKFEELQKKYKSSVFIDMYHEGGPTNLHISDFQNPFELINNANLFLDSFKVEPDNVAVPYYVALAPISIANGPLPPNAADLEHAQDVLVACTKARSRLLDKLNLLEYILDNDGKFDFNIGAGKADVQKAVQNFQADLDLIAECATTAIRKPAEAAMPATFASNTGKVYPLGILPDNLPLPKASKMATVPDFAGCKSWTACNETATRVGLVAQQHIANMQQQDEFKVLNFTPPAGTTVPEGTVINITTQPIKIDWSKFVIVKQHAHLQHAHFHSLVIQK